MAKFEIYKDARGEYRWRLKSGNGQVIATGGEGYVSKAGAENGIQAVMRDAPGATLVDQTDAS
ncbi:MAG: YegP family protein [Micromonosporaceae bacterium]